MINMQCHYLHLDIINFTSRLLERLTELLVGVTQHPWATKRQAESRDVSKREGLQVRRHASTHGIDEGRSAWVHE